MLLAKQTQDAGTPTEASDGDTAQPEPSKVTQQVLRVGTRRTPLRSISTDTHTQKTKESKSKVHAKESEVSSQIQVGAM